LAAVHLSVREEKAARDRKKVARLSGENQDVNEFPGSLDLVETKKVAKAGTGHRHDAVRVSFLQGVPPVEALGCERKMNLHPLPADAKCPYCGKGGLAFVRERRLQGDLYRCTAATPCQGLALHYRKDLGVCGVAAKAISGHLLHWTACLDQELSQQDELTEEHLTTRQAAERLRVSKNRVIGLVRRGKLPGRKIGSKWLIPVAAVRQYCKTASVRHRVTSR
jgi:excisionase family DNA binding protein